MALQGVHIVFSAVSAPNSLIAALSTNMVAAQKMPTPGTSTVSAPPNGLLLTISTSAPIYYSIGPSPADPAPALAVCGYLDPALGPKDIFVNAGDFFRWALA